MNKPLGTFVRFQDLSSPEKTLVEQAVTAAKISKEMKLCEKSDFPVGSAIRARDKDGNVRTFSGSNVENRYLSASICAERSAAVAAVSEKFVHFEAISVFCLKIPGGSPCGLCRQVIVELAPAATVLCVQDHDQNVHKFIARELLPEPKAQPVQHADLRENDRQVVEKLLHLVNKAHAPYTKGMRAAIFEAIDDSGSIEVFSGLTDENASFGATAQAEATAMRSARTAGFKKCKKLFATIDRHGPNPLDGESLQILREFGAEADILLVDPSGLCVATSLTELLPDSFGPESL